MNKNTPFKLLLVLSIIITFSSCVGPAEEHPQADLVRRSIAAGETELDTAMYAISDIVGSSMGAGQYYTVHFDEALNAIVVSQWFTGLAHDTEVALRGNEAARTTWLNSANSVASASASSHELTVTVGADVDVIIHILSDVDPDVVFLTAKNGVIIYSVVQ